MKTVHSTVSRDSIITHLRMQTLGLKDVTELWTLRSYEDSTAQYHVTLQINATLQSRSSICNPIDTNLSQIAQSEMPFICAVHANRDGTQNFYKGNWKSRKGPGGGVRTKRAQRRAGFQYKGREKKLNRRTDQGRKGPIPNFISIRVLATHAN
jgi:hypothetical protein